MDNHSKKNFLNQIDHLFEQYNQVMEEGNKSQNSLGSFRPIFSNNEQPYHGYHPVKIEAIISISLNLIHSIIGPHHTYSKRVNKILKTYFKKQKNPLLETYSTTMNEVYQIERIIGVIEAMRIDLVNDNLTSWFDSKTTEVYSDYLEIAENFLNHSKIQDANELIPPAILIGITFEMHLKHLAKNRLLDLFENKKTKKLDKIKTELRGLNLFNKTETKGITEMIGISNDAAHGDFEEYVKKDID